jgi:hypothetical protein
MTMMTIEEIKAAAVEVAAALRNAELVPAEVRARFIAVRAALFQRGVFDPLLVRFDSATVPKAPNGEIAEELTKVAESL